MDIAKCGKFIAELRRERGLTQSQLAGKIGVTDKAVSKWETGRGFPDVSVLPALSEALGATVTELVNGERSRDALSQEDVDRAVTAALEEAGRSARRYASAAFFILGAVCAVLPLYLVGGGVLLPYGAALIAAGIILRWDRAYHAVKGALRRVSQRAAAAFAGGFAAAALVCELLPFSAAMVFAAGPDSTVTQYTSYFSLLQIGYGNLLLIATAGCTIAVIILSAVRFFVNKKGLSRAAVICAAAGAVCTAAVPLIFGMGEFTPFTAIIAVLLGVSSFLSAR